MTDQDPTPPHDYIPAGPVKTVLLGFEPPEVRGAAFAALLDGVPLGAEDRQIIGWLAALCDDSTCRTVASIMWRCRVAGLPAGQETTHA